MGNVTPQMRQNSAQVMKGDYEMNIIALCISALSLTVAFAGTYLANKRAKDAISASRSAVTDAKWLSLQEAVQRLIVFDPAADPIDERLVNLRIAMIDLVDNFESWTDLDDWFESERILGALLARQSMERAKPNDGVEERLENLEPFMSWAQGFSHNLRRLRSAGHDREALATLKTNAERLIASTCERNGWQLPSHNPRLKPIH